MKKFTFLLTLLVTSLSFGQIFITELTDPNNEFSAKYLELYNAGNSDIDLSTGYTIENYANGGTSSNSLSLTGIIAAKGFYIIANSTNFTTQFGITPNQVSSTFSSNGDDQVQLIDANSQVIDQFGTIGTHGDDTCQEYTDGRAVRIATVTSGNGGNWDESKWIIGGENNIDGCTAHSFASINTTDNIFDPGAWVGAPVTNTIVAFTASASQIEEDGNTIDVCISITNPDNSTSTTVQLNINNTSTTTNGDDYTTMSYPQTIIFPAGSQDDQCVTFTILDDPETEPSETIVLDLQNIAGGNNAELAISQHTLTIGSSDVPVSKIFITELADPEDNTNARFVELFNAGTTDVDLATDGYSLQRYTNSNSSPSDAIALTGTIKTNGFYIIARDSTAFHDTYGFAPNQVMGSGTAADSNGDDQIQLIDINLNTLDIFGIPQEDGTGTCHEFEDGRAERIQETTQANAGNWDEANWIVRADNSPDNGCTNHTNDPLLTTSGIFNPGTWYNYSTLSIKENTISDLVISSANGTITTNKGEVVTIYNVLGQKVSNQNLTTGIYVVLIQEGTIVVSEKIYVN